MTALKIVNDILNKYLEDIKNGKIDELLHLLPYNNALNTNKLKYEIFKMQITINNMPKKYKYILNMQEKQKIKQTIDKILKQKVGETFEPEYISRYSSHI